jgi:hypothetical protein
MDLDFYAVVTSVTRRDGVWLVEARCETCRADVHHGGGPSTRELPDLGARVPHCRCPFPAYIIIPESDDHPIPPEASKAELRSNEPLTDAERGASWYDCPGCHAKAHEPCNSTYSRWRTCPARLARLLKR